MHKIRIRSGNRHWEAVLNTSVTAASLMEALPLTGVVNTWGAEIYFSIPLQVQLEPDACEEVPVGTLAYWPPGSAFCIFFGQTPASESDMPKAASKVNILGSIRSGLDELKSVKEGEVIEILAL